MSTVVDSSVLVAARVDTGPHGAWAETVLAGGSLYAPELARAEATNIFRRLERAKLITTPAADAARNDLMQLDIDLFPFGAFPDRISELRHNVTSYGAWYVVKAPARNSGRTSFEIKRSHLRLPDARTLNLAPDCVTRFA